MTFHSKVLNLLCNGLKSYGAELFRESVICAPYLIKLVDTKIIVTKYYDKKKSWVLAVFYTHELSDLDIILSCIENIVKNGAKTSF